MMVYGSLVSVIIPVYNVAPYLAEALDSVIHQTYENLEILIIDDGSTDGSGAICDRYATEDARISVIHQENQGLSAARNAGLNRMSGEAVAFLDSDDAYEDIFIEKLLTAMIINNADMTGCKASILHTTGKLKQGGQQTWSTGAFRTYDHASGLHALADGEIGVGVWSKLYHRELWREIRFPDGHVYEDLDTTFRVIDLCDTICILDERLYLYRRRLGSITATPSMKNICDRNLAYSHSHHLLRRMCRKSSQRHKQEDGNRLHSMG